MFIAEGVMGKTHEDQKTKIEDNFLFGREWASALKQNPRLPERNHETRLDIPAIGQHSGQEQGIQEGWDHYAFWSSKRVLPDCCLGTFGTELNMARTARIKQRIIQCLMEYGEANSADIYSYVKSTTRHGATMQQISNLLAKDKRIVKTGMDRIGRFGSHETYQVATWKLKDTEHVYHKGKDHESG